jgi:hypothetical protein
MSRIYCFPREIFLLSTDHASEERRRIYAYLEYFHCFHRGLASEHQSHTADGGTREESYETYFKYTLQSTNFRVVVSVDVNTKCLD